MLWLEVSSLNIMPEILAKYDLHVVKRHSMPVYKVDGATEHSLVHSI